MGNYTEKSASRILGKALEKWPSAIFEHLEAPVKAEISAQKF